MWTALCVVTGQADEVKVSAPAGLTAKDLEAVAAAVLSYAIDGGADAGAVVAMARTMRSVASSEAPPPVILTGGVG